LPKPQGTKLRAAAEAISVRIARSAADAVREVELVISAVTAASSGDAAESVKAHLRGNPFFIDINSVSPPQAGHRQTARRRGALHRCRVGADYPARHQTPMLIAGPHSQAVAPTLAGLGMRASIAGTEIGAAASIKMVRSVIRASKCSRSSAFWQPREPASLMKSLHRCATIIPGSIGQRSSPTTWKGWRLRASAEPLKWKKWPKLCVSSGSSLCHG
jgi:hypothetical protein